VGLGLPGWLLAWLSGLVVLRQLAVLLFHFVLERSGGGPGFLSRFLSPFFFGFLGKDSSPIWGRR
jgi:hypothetical protein